MNSKDSSRKVLLNLLAVILVVLGFSLGGEFFSIQNLQSMAFQIPEFTFLALAMSISMLSGGIDLSIVANANLGGIFGAMILTSTDLKTSIGLGAVCVLAVAVTLLITSLAGLLNGILVTVFAVPPILATLGSMMFLSGIGMAITDGEGVVGFPDFFLGFGLTTVLGLPLIFVVAIIFFIVTDLLMSNTVYGNSLYLYGGNTVASLFSGIRNNRILVVSYIISGFMAGMCSVIMLLRLNSARVGYGDSYLLQAILVAVLGGIDPFGGKGKIINVLIGIIILQVLQSAFTIFGFTPYAKKLIWGTMLLMVMINHFVSNYVVEKKRVKSILAQK